MGDALDDNFILESDIARSSTNDDKGLSKRKMESDELNSGSKKKLRYNWREECSACDGSAENQYKLLAGAFQMNHQSEGKLGLLGISESSFLPFSNLESNDTLLNKSDDIDAIIKKTITMHAPSILVICPTITRCSVIVSEFKNLGANPLGLYYHGEGRKKEQSSQMERKLKDSSVCVGVPGRIEKVLEFFPSSSLICIAIDLTKDRKGLNILSVNETRTSLLNILSSGIITDKVKLLFF